MWYLRARHLGFNFLRATLTHGAPGLELHPPVPLTPHTSEGGTKLCVTAAIGVMYDGKFSALRERKRLNLRFQAPTVLVAVRTALVPPSTASDIEGLDMNFALSIPDSVSEAGPSNEREMWGEDPTIDFFELTVRFENLLTSTQRRLGVDWVVTLSL